MNPNEIFGSSGNNTNFVTFEEMQAAFSTPTQRQCDYEQPDPSTGSGEMGDLSHLADPTGQAFSDFELLDDEPAHVDPERARRTGERIARLIDTGIDFTLSNFVAKNNETYRADDRDLQDIADCWGELAEEKGWSIGPEWSLIILYIMVYGPLVKQALTDRRMAELEARQSILEEQMKTIQMNQQGTQPQPTTDGSTSNTANPTSSPFTHAPKP